MSSNELKIEVDVRAFHNKFGHPAPLEPTRPRVAWVQLRKRLIREEAEELCEAIDDGDVVKIAREACDLIYVAVGTLVAWGIPLAPCWRALQAANMEKEPAEEEGQKPSKPEGWVSPDGRIAKALGATGCMLLMLLLTGCTLGTSTPHDIYPGQAYPDTSGTVITPEAMDRFIEWRYRQKALSSDCHEFDTSSRLKKGAYDEEYRLRHRHDYRHHHRDRDLHRRQ